MSVRNVLDWLEAAAGQFPDHPAYLQPDACFTWGQVHDLARRAGSAIARLIPAQSPVLILVDKTPACLCAMMGTVYAGCYYTPLDASMPEARMMRIVETLRPALIVYEEKYASLAQRMGEAGQTLSFSALTEDADDDLLAQRRRAHIDQDLLYVLFTSGSTGQPKGVSITHAAVIDFVEWACDDLRLPQGLRFGSQAPFYFDNSVLDIYCAMRMAGSLYLIPRGDFLFPQRLLDCLRKGDIDTLFWVPSALGALSGAEVLTPGCLPKLKRVFFCGEVMPCTVLNQWRQVFPQADYVNMYGPTEVTDVCTWYRVDRPFADTDKLPIGFPCGNTRIVLLDGEICVGGVCLSPGYYRDPEKTAAAFVQNPLRPERAERLYRTGDLGAYNDRGELMFLGRRDSQIKRMGYRIELGEVEAALQNVPDIGEVGCFYAEDQGLIVAAYTGAAAEKAVKAALRGVLPKYMMPDVYLHRERLPHTGSGKLDRRTLRQEAADEHLIP